MTDGLKTPAADWLAGGEMGKVVRDTDWSESPLGPIESWPQSLRTTASLCLASNFPINIIWGPDRVQIYNDGYWPICGGKHPRSMGQDFKECWFSAWPAIGEAFEQAAAGRAAFLENSRMFLDRYGYLEETFFTFSFSPIRDDTGQVAGLFHPVTEMTQATLAERRLQVLRDLADKTAEAKTVDDACAVITHTLDGHALDLPFVVLYLMQQEGKQARLVSTTGVQPGTSIAPRLVDLADESFVWPLAEAARSGQSIEVTDLDLRFSGLACRPYPEPPTTAFVLPLVTPGLGAPLGFLVAGVSARRAVDGPYRMFYSLLRESVTTGVVKARAYEEERRRAEALAELDRAKTSFFSNVSHEFRTPLTLMLGPIEGLLAPGRTDLSPAAATELEVVHRNGLRLLRLVNTLLDFSRIEAGRVRASYVPTDLAAVTADLASVFRAAVEQAGLRLVIDCPALGGPAFVDREMWEKVVLNLLSNAFKFTFEGEIEVSLRQVGQTAELRVRDTGIGIPPAEMPRIFERFHRIENARGRTHEGSGIGLALVQELVKLHGGAVRAESRLGQGATFTVTIPLGSAHLPADRIGPERALASTASGAIPYVDEAMRWLPNEKRDSPVPALADHDVSSTGALQRCAHRNAVGARVLVADDNEDMRQYLVRLLAERYDVHAVPDGESALAAARTHLPDLILADVMMPRLDGFGLLRALRADARTAGVPIIMLSARAGEESRVEGMEAGADDYLVKPFSARELLARVSAHLQMSRLRREADKAIRESNTRFESLFNAAPLAVYLVDSDMRIRQVNPKARPVFGDIEDLVGSDFTEVMHVLWPKSYADEIVERFRHTLETGEPYYISERVEERLDRKVTEYYEWQIHRLSLPDGKYGVVCYFSDVSAHVQARKLVEEARQQAEVARLQAEAANAAKSDLLAAMSHELRTPLNAIAGHVQLVDMGIHGPVTSAQHEALARVQRSQQLLLSLINDVLNFAKLEAGRVEYDVCDVPLASAVDDIRAMTETQLAAKGITYDAQIPHGLVVRADRERLQQILLNLLSNAIKFTPRGGRVTVDAPTRGQGPSEAAFLRVMDTGIGIPRDKQDTIFDPFVQVHRNLTRTMEGTGLGLAISRDLARGMAGDLRVRSVEGEGSTFTLELPRAR